MWVLMLSVGLLVIQKALSVPPRELYVLIVKYYLITSVSKKNKCCSDCSAWLTAVLHLRKQWVSEWSETKSTLFAVSMVHSVHYSLMWVTVSRKFIFSKLKNWGLAHKLVDNKNTPYWWYSMLHWYFFDRTTLTQRKLASAPLMFTSPLKQTFKTGSAFQYSYYHMDHMHPSNSAVWGPFLDNEKHPRCHKGSRGHNTLSWHSFTISKAILILVW